MEIFIKKINSVKNNINNNFDNNQQIRIFFSFISISILVFSFIFVFLLYKLSIIPYLGTNVTGSNFFSIFTLLTNIFYHNNISVLVGDIIFLIVIGPPFFYVFKLYKGLLYYFVIGVSGELISIILFFILNIWFEVHGFNANFNVRGSGSSGANIGSGLISLIILKNNKNAIIEKITLLLDTNKQIISGAFYLAFVLYIYSFVVTILTDIHLFSSFLLALLLKVNINTGLMITIIEWCTFDLQQILVILTSSNKIIGTPYLIHTCCVMTATVIYFLLLKRKINQQKNCIQKFS